MSSPKTLNREFSIIAGHEIGRHIKILGATQDELEVDRTTAQIRERGDGGRPFVTLSIERIPVVDRSLTKKVRQVMQEQSRQLALLIRESGFTTSVISLGGIKTEVLHRPDNEPGFLLSVWIDVLDEVGLLQKKSSPYLRAP